jgi:hypothetical protein
MVPVFHRSRRIRPLRIPTEASSSKKLRPCGIIGLRRFRVSLRFAPLGGHVDDAVFRRESFLSKSVGGPSGLSPRANPLRLSAERAFPTDLDSDIPCRPYGATPRLPPPEVARDVAPEGAAPGSPNISACRIAQDWSPACRLELTASQPRMPSIGSILTFW